MAAPPRPPSSAPVAALLSGGLRTFSARYRLPRVVAAVAIAVIAAGLVERAHDRAAEAAAGWDTATEPVLVVVRDVPAGALIETDAVALRLVPIALRPHDAVDVLPAGARSRVDLAPGEVVRSARLDPAAASAIAALLPTGHLAFSVSADDLEVATGDTVRLYDLATGAAFVTRATVLQVHDGQLMIAVPDSEAPGLIAAIGTAGVVPALTGPAATPGS